MKKLILTFLISVLFTLPAFAYTETFYVCHGGDGTLPETNACATALDEADFNNAANWDVDDQNDGKIGLNDLVELMDDGGDLTGLNPPGVSGTNGNPITIAKQAGDTVVVAGAATNLDLTDGEDYLTFENIIFRDATYRNINAVNNTGIVFDGITADCPTSSPNFYVNYMDTVDNFEIKNSIFSCMDDATLDEDQYDTLAIINSDHGYLHNNTFSHSSHVSFKLRTGNTQIVVKDNTFNNKWRHAFVIEAGSSYILIEGNTFIDIGIDTQTNPNAYDNGKWVASLRFIGAGGIKIARKNIFDSNNAGFSAAITTAEEIYYYNNTHYNAIIYDNGVTAAPGQHLTAYDDVTIKDSVILNNIFSMVEGPDYIEVNRNAANPEPTGNTIEYNNFYDDIVTTAYWGDVRGSQTPADHDVNNADGWANSLNVDPELADPANDDFTLQNGSPMIDAGRWLTEVNDGTDCDATSEDCTIMVVDDANYFYDGWSIVGETADYIWVDNPTEADFLEQISSINYGTDTITLVSEHTFEDGADVYLAYSSTVGLIGTAPDIGAEEYLLQVYTVSPVDGDTNISVTASATWDYVAAVDDADIWLDKAACSTVACDGSLVSDDDADKIYDMSTLDIDSTYCLAIRANDGAQQGSCQEFEFITTSGPPTDPTKKASIKHSSKAGNIQHSPSGVIIVSDAFSK